MNDFLPLFPLKMVVFPNEKLNLHVFEPRYKQLIRECDENGITFGIPAFLNEKVMDFGTEIKLLEIVKKHPNGEIDIKTQGIGIFKINEFYRIAPNKLYSGADIIRIQYSDDREESKNEKIISLLTELFSLLKITKKIEKNPFKFRTFEVAHHVGFSVEQEYEFLCIRSEIERQGFLIKHLENLIPVVKEMERLRQKAKMNGHFKDAIPPKLNQ